MRKGAKWKEGLRCGRGSRGKGREDDPIYFVHAVLC